MYQRPFAVIPLSLTLLFALAGNAPAQQQTPPPATSTQARGTITGLVKDRVSGQPLAAATVLVNSTALGATTTAEGRFVITNVPPGIHTISTKRVGYAPTTLSDIRVVAGTPTTVELLISEQALILNSVVTTGLNDPATGTRAPFSVAQINSDRLQVASVGSPLEALSGKVAGLSIRGGNTPGSDVVIQIRNPLSVSAYTQPMIIVDGVIQMQDDPSLGARSFTGSPLDLSSENIESIEIVRGAAAAALYGQRAANGVINITTKRGAGDANVGQTRFNVVSEYGYSSLAKELPRNMHHSFRVDENNQFIDNFGRPINSVLEGSLVTDANRIYDNEYGVPTYDNVAALFKRGSSFRGDFSLGQSSLATNFSLSGGSRNETGVIKMAGGASSQNFGVNLDYRAGSVLSVGTGMQYSKNYTERIATVGSMFLAAEDISRSIDITRIDPATGDYIPFPDGNNQNRYNPLYFEPKRDTWDKRTGAQANGTLRFRPTSVLSLTASGGYTRADRESQLTWVPRGVLTTGNNQSHGEYDITQASDESYNGNVRAGFLTGHGAWTLRGGLRAGGQIQDRGSIDIAADTLLNNSPDLDYLRRITDLTHTVRESRVVDYSVDVAFDYNQRYVLDVVYRTDGSSLQPPATRYNSNGRLSAAWQLSEEPWWPLSSFTLFKPRYSIGTAGQNPPFAAQYELYNRPDGTELVSKQNMGNINIVPEKVTEQEFGLDMTFNNRYSLSLTYVRNVVENTIRPDTILAYAGFSTQQANLGNLRGDNYEATFEAQWISKRDLRWSSQLVLDRGRQKITSYPRQCEAAATQTSLNRFCEGYVFGDLYGYYMVRDEYSLHPLHHANGNLDYFQKNDEGYIVPVGRGGSWTDARWGQMVDVDGISYHWGLPMLASRFDAGGLRRTGSAITKIGFGLPEVAFGFGNQVQYKNWSASMQTVGQLGGQIWNQAAMSRVLRGVHVMLDQSGKPEYLKKPETYYENAQLLPANSASLTNGREDHVMKPFIEDGDFLKLTELRVAYRLDQGLPLLRRLGMTSGSIAMVARDLLTITNYSGYDPQVSGNASWTSARTDRSEVPPYRNFTVQLRLVF